MSDLLDQWEVWIWMYHRTCTMKRENNVWNDRPADIKHYGNWLFLAEATTTATGLFMPDLESQRVCPTGSLHCPAGWSCEASGRARMGTGCTVVLYCAPRAESLGSHPQTGLGGWTLETKPKTINKINDCERQNPMVTFKKPNNPSAPPKKTTKMYLIITVDL